MLNCNYNFDHVEEHKTIFMEGFKVIIFIVWCRKGVGKLGVKKLSLTDFRHYL